ncbi:transposase [Luteimonas sp. B3_2_R+30]|uniref:Transposase n=1 Tax=Luteimonas salinilitoris TaxID=3237697 RepID=A0ABV4HWW6_9GAMM
MTHWADAPFLSELEGVITAQVGQIERQIPQPGQARIDFREEPQRWSGLLSTDGTLLGQRAAPRQRASSVVPGRRSVTAGLKTPYRDGTTHVIFEPLDFIAKLAALVPPPRVHLTRFHGAFAPNSRDRALITPARRGRGGQPAAVPEEAHDRTPAEQHAAMRWAQRLKRVFKIDLNTCPTCGGAVKLIACIEAPAVIAKILTHLGHQAPAAARALFPEPRAPPPARLFD